MNIHHQYIKVILTSPYLIPFLIFLKQPVSNALMSSRSFSIFTHIPNLISSRVVKTGISFSSRVIETGVSFSPAGLLSPYHIGAAQQLINYDIINDNTAVSGSSGGALAAILVALRMDLGDAMKGMLVGSMYVCMCMYVCIVFFTIPHIIMVSKPKIVHQQQLV